MITIALKWKCHFDQIFIIGTVSCQNFQCCHWRKFHQDYIITVFSVTYGMSILVHVLEVSLLVKSSEGAQLIKVLCYAY